LDRLDALDKPSITFVGESRDVLAVGRRLRRHAIPHRVRRETSFLFTTVAPAPVEFTASHTLAEFDTSKYHSYDEHVAFLHTVQTTGLGNLSEIGASRGCRVCHVAGRSYQDRPLYCVRVGDDAALPTVLVDGGIHAREWIAPATAFFLLKHILLDDAQLRNSANWLVVGKAETMVDRVFVPNLNPDGYVFSRTVRRYWRKNRSGEYCRWANQRCCGTDLNRNFPFQWGGACRVRG